MQYKHLCLSVAAASATFLGAQTASADLLAAYNFNTFADAESNPAAPDVADSPLVSATDLTRDAVGNGLGTLAATQTRHAVLPGNTPAVFADTALALGLGTTANNPFGDPPTAIVASQDFMTFSVTSTSDTLELTSFSFDYGASVRDSDTTGLLSGAQLFYSVNGGDFNAIGDMQVRSVPDGGGTFTGFINSTIDLGSIGTLGLGDTVDFRLSFGDNSSATTGQKSVYIDNLALEGVVPEPGTAGLLAMAGAGLLIRRRRA